MKGVNAFKAIIEPPDENLVSGINSNPRRWLDKSPSYFENCLNKGRFAQFSRGHRISGFRNRETLRLALIVARSIEKANGLRSGDLGGGFFRVGLL